MERTYQSWLLATFHEDECQLKPFAEQKEALQAYLLTYWDAILYEIHVGKEPLLREVMRKEADS